MKKKQVTAILLSAIMSVSACLPASNISAFAAESTAEIAAVEEVASNDDASASSESSEGASTVDVSSEGSDVDPTEDVQSINEQPGNEQAVNEQVNAENSGDGETEVETVQEEASSEDVTTSEAVTENSPEIEAAADDASTDATIDAETTDGDEEEEVADESVKKEQKSGTGYSFATALEIPVGGSVNGQISVADGYTYYYFVPDETRMYTINGSSSDGFSFYGQAYDYKHDHLASSCDWNGFNLEIMCAAGQRYYIRVNDDFMEGQPYNYTISVAKKDISFCADAHGGNTHTVVADEPVTLSIDAYSTAPISYSWSRDGVEVSSDETYTFTPEQECTVECNVSSEGGSESITFYIKIDNRLAASGNYIYRGWGNQYIANITPNDTPELHVDVTAINTNGVTYQWKEGAMYEDWTDIPDANTSTYTPETKDGEYCCEVTDKYGNKVTVYFKVKIDNQLTAYFDGYQDIRTIKVSAGSSLTLRVIANAIRTDSIHYSWQVDNDHLDVNSDTITFDSVDKRTDVYCTVTDDYGGNCYLPLTIEVDNNLKVYDGETNNSGYIYISAAPGETLNFNPVIEMNDSQGAVYKWYKMTQFYGDFTDGESELIDGANGTSYSATPSHKMEAYELVVTDRYSNQARIRYCITLDNNFKAYPEGADEDESRIVITLQPGESATLKTIATATETDGIKYRWCTYVDHECIWLDGENTDTLSTPVNHNSEYECRVTDKFGTSKDVSFEVIVDNNLSVSPEGNSAIQNCTKTVRIMPGSTAILRAAVNANEFDGLEYIWYKDGSVVDGVTGPNCEVSGNYSAVYKCKVSDPYGNTGEAIFNVIINNRLVVYPEGAHNHGQLSTIYSTPAEGTVLRAIVSAYDMDSLTYSWSAYKEIDEYTIGWQTIEGAETAQYVLTEDDASTVRYKCVVSDVYGNRGEAEFKFVGSDGAGASSDFKAYPEGAEIINTATGEHSCEVTIYSGPEVELITLKAIVETDHPDEIEYEWREGEDNTISTGTDSIVVSPTRKTTYMCVVRDKQNGRNVKELYFYIIKNRFRARTEGMEGYDYDLSYANINLLPGQEYTLRAIVEAEDSNGLTYRWSSNDESTIGTEDSLTITATKDQNYYCRIQDKYGNFANLVYYVHISDFSIRPKGADKFVLPNRAYVYYVPGEGSTLAVEIDGDPNAEYTYEWKCEDYDAYDGERLLSTESTYFINADEGILIRCVVKNKFGTTKAIVFECIPNHFYAYGDTQDIGKADWTWEYCYLHKATPGIGCNLKVNVTADDLSKVTYDWYEYRVIDPNAEYVEEKYKAFQIATDTDSIDVNPDGDGRYSCLVRDGYGNSKWLYYNVRADGNLTVTPTNIEGGEFNSTTNRITLNTDAGRQLTLGANATISDNSELFYTWQSKKLEGINSTSDLDYGWTIIGTGSDSIQVTATENTRYECVVHDQYGNTATASYDILVDEVVPVERIDFSEPELRITYETTMQLQPIVFPEDATVKALKWESSDNEIISVDSYGTITTHYHEGVAYVTATSDDGSVSATCRIIVKQRYLNGPEIVKQPVDVTAQNGEKVRFRVVANGNVLTYRWEYSRGEGLPWVEWPGKTSDDVYVTSTASNDGFLYRCIISDGIDSITSEPAKLTMYKGPTFITQPEDIAAEIGEHATFHAEATGTNVSYQWEYSTDNGANWIEMEGETGTEITVEVSNDTDGNLYRCVAGNGTESIASEPAKLSVSKAPIITKQPENVSVKNGSKASFRVEAVGRTSGEELNYQWEYRKNENEGWREWTGKTSAEATATAGPSNNGFLYRCKVSNNAGTAVSEAAQLTLYEGPEITSQPEDVEVADGEQATFVVVATGENLAYQWEYSSDGGENWNNCENGNGAEITVVAGEDTYGNLYRCTVSNSGGSVTSEPAELKAFSGPVITKQPEDVSVKSGQRATFRIEASGNEGEELSYQWEYKKTGTDSWNIWTGKTSAEATATASSSNDGFLYRCKVSNESGTVVSEAAQLTLYTGPEITSQPEDAEVVSGGQATFSVAATGEDLAYQWEYSSDGGENWAVCSNGSGAEITVVAGEDTYGNLYRCTVSNSGGSVTSDPAELKAYSGPVITKQPEDVSVKSGQRATFRIEASGNEGEELSYQWEYRKNENESWREWTGKTSAEATATAGPSNNGFLYRCRVSNGAGTAVSETAQLTLYTGPEITSQPEDVEVASGGQATFSVAATGEDLAYQWEYSSDGGENWTICSDGSGAEIIVEAGEDTYGNLYRCTVSNSGGSVTSESAELKAYSGPVITKQPESVSVKSGRRATFRIEASGNEGEELSYQWEYRKNENEGWRVWTGKTSAEATATASSSNDGFQYRCKVSNSAGTAVSEAAQLTLYEGPEITSQPEDAEALSGEQVTFRIVAAGEDLTYQWEYSSDGGESWTICSNGSGAEITVEAGEDTYGNLYRCTVSNGDGSVTSDPAELKIYRGPVITKQPEEVIANIGERATFRIEASGNEGEELSYQWEYKKDDIEGWRVWTGKTSAEATATAGPSNNGFYYRCKVSNGAGTAVSEAARLILNR